MNFWVFVLASAAGLWVPLVLASLGEVISERAGVINIGLGGMMTAGAYFGYTTTVATHSAIAGVGMSMVAGAVTAAIMAAIAVWRNANQILTGFAIFIMVPALCDFFYIQRNDSTATGGVGSVAIPLLSKLPLVGKSLFDQTWFFYASVLLIPVVVIILERTYWGLRATASGHAPAIALTKGVSVVRTRVVAVIICGAAAGVGGAALTVGVLGSYTPGVVSSQGFVALAIVILGRWRVTGTALAAAVLALADALELRLAASSNFPPELLAATPWVLVIIVLVISARRGSGVPGALAGETPRL